MKKVLIPALLALSLTLPLAATAEDRPGPERPGMAIERVFQQLDLTPEQKGKLETIHASHQDAAKPLQEQMRTKMKDLFTLMKSTNASKEQALAKQHEIEDIQRQLGDMRLNAWFEARNILTPDQLKKLEALKMPRKRH